MVKSSHDADGYGINRNIVECKDIYYLQNYFSEIRINRNIVECKEICSGRYPALCIVLIET